MNIERDVVLALKQVYDPEIPVKIYDLGLIYEIRVNEEQEVYIQMTLTAPNCPMADFVVEQVKQAIEDVPGVMRATIDLVFEPVWDKSRMSEEALVELGMDEDCGLSLTRLQHGRPQRQSRQGSRDAFRSIG